MEEKKSESFFDFITKIGSAKPKPNKMSPPELTEFERWVKFSSITTASIFGLNFLVALNEGKNFSNQLIKKHQMPLGHPKIKNIVFSSSYLQLNFL